MEQQYNIFEALKRAMTVGGNDTSMQSPDLDTDVLDRALAGQATAEEVVLWLHESADDTYLYTVAVLQTATTDNGIHWELASGESIWTM